MKYEELKKFIREKMRMEDGHNYQPVVIRTLNQNHGKATKEEIIDELCRYNPEYPKSHFTNCTAFEVLEKHNVIKFNSNINKYELLDYDEIDTFYGRKAEITKLCDEKMSGTRSQPIEELIKEFDQNRNFSKTTPDWIKKGEQQREHFVTKFPKNKTHEIKLEGYVAGKVPTDKNSFSYLVEFGTESFGMVGGGSARKFGVWMKKDTQEYMFTKDFGNAEEAITKIKGRLIELLDAVEKFTADHDWNRLSNGLESKKNYLSLPITSKILTMYYPDQLLHVWSHDWVNSALAKFDLSADNLGEKEGFYIKQGKLVDYKNSHPIMKNWSNRYFSYFLNTLLDTEEETDEAEAVEDQDITEHEIEKLKSYNRILSRKKQIIFYGPPGTGKTYSADKLARYIIRKNSKNQEENQTSTCDFVTLVTFHPSYSYEEFVEGIMPEAKGNQIEFAIKDGVFKKVCKCAEEDPENKYVLIIDEINRGNIPKIFGELITLIENDKRGEYEVLLTYSKESFTVPENLFIIGTMNTADRSLVMLDTALRRRFGFVELMPDSSQIKETIPEISLQKILDAINSKLKTELRDKQIGHSFFMDKIDSVAKLQLVFETDIIPLLQEYFYEDYEKLRKILGSDFIDDKNKEIKSEWKTDSNKFVDALKAFLENG